MPVFINVNLWVSVIRGTRTFLVEIFIMSYWKSVARGLSIQVIIWFMWCNHKRIGFLLGPGK